MITEDCIFIKFRWEHFLQFLKIFKFSLDKNINFV